MPSPFRSPVKVTTALGGVKPPVGMLGPKGNNGVGSLMVSTAVLCAPRETGASPAGLLNVRFTDLGPSGCPLSRMRIVKVPARIPGDNVSPPEVAT